MSVKIIFLLACIVLLKSNQFVSSQQCFGGDLTRGLNLGVVNGNIAGIRIPQGIAGGSCLSAVPNTPNTPPIGVSVSSDDLIIDGCINVAGTLPFQSAVLVEAVIPCGGQAQVVYGCGNGNVGIFNDGPFADLSNSAASLLFLNNGIPGLSGCGYSV